MWKVGLCLFGFLFLHLHAEVIELPPSDWSQNIINAPPQITGNGHQVLHFGMKDYPYTDCPEGALFVSKVLHKAKAFVSDADLLRFALDQVTLKGAYVELGVTTGKTINFIAALNPSKVIYGFDSFLGSPEDYVKDHTFYPKGTFGLIDPTKPPLVLSNVKLIQGDFKESLPYFIENYLQDSQIAFLHVDCDLYSSTITALEILEPYLRHGTIIVFDDFYNYPEYAEFEFKAFYEYLRRFGYYPEYIGYNAMMEGVAVRLLSD